MIGDTQFEHGLLNWCTTIEPVSKTMNCEKSTTLELHYFKLDPSW